jgi:FecR protein
MIAVAGPLPFPGSGTKREGDMRGMAAVWKATAIGIACIAGIPASAAAQAKAGVVTTLQGTATVARSTAAQPTPLRFRDDVFVHDHIVTGESAIVRILLGGRAVVTVRERSALTIHETPTTSTIEIGSGKIALAVARARMKPGESVQIKTPNAMAGVRGTVVIADVAAPAGGAVTTRFTLLTGIVDVARLDAATGQATGQLVTLRPLQTIAVTGGLPPGAVRALGSHEAQSIADDYKVVLPPPPPSANAQVTEQQIELAVQHSAALTEAEPDAEDGTRAIGDRTASGGDTAAGGAGSDPPRAGSLGAAIGAGNGSVGAGGSVTVGGGTLSAGGSVAVGGGTLGAGASIAAGGGGITVGAGVGVGGIGAGGSVTVGGGSGTGSSGGGGLLGGIVPKILR